MVCPIELLDKDNKPFKPFDAETTSALKLFRTNYFGCKKRHLPEIAKLFPPITEKTGEAETVADIFSGTGSVGYFLKRLNYRIISNDILKYAALRATVWIKNNKTVLDEEDIRFLCSNNPNRKDYFERYYLNVFGKDNCRFLDNWASNVQALPDEMKRNIAVFIPIFCSSIHIKHPSVHWGAFKTISGQHDLLDIDLKQEVCDYALLTFKRLLYDNGQENLVYNEDAVGLIEKIQADILYLDTPYGESASQYEDYYAFYDDMVSLLSDKGETVVNPYDSKAELPPYADFTKPVNVRNGFCKLFSRSLHIPKIVVSYNSTSKVQPQEIACIAEVYRKSVTAYVIPSCRRPTRRKKRTDEHLIVCREAAAEYNGREVTPELPVFLTDKSDIFQDLPIEISVGLN